MNNIPRIATETVWVLAAVVFGTIGMLSLILIVFSL